MAFLTEDDPTNMTEKTRSKKRAVYEEIITLLAFIASSLMSCSHKISYNSFIVIPQSTATLNGNLDDALTRNK